MTAGGPAIRTFAIRAALFLALLGVVLGMARLTIDNSPGAWLDPAHPAAQALRESRDLFGSDEYILVACEGIDPWSPEGWDAQQRMGDALAGDARLAAAVSLPGVLRALGAPDAAPPHGRLRAMLSEAPPVRDLLLPRGGNSFGILFPFSQAFLDGKGSSRERAELVGWVEDKLTALAPAGARLWFLGPAAFNVRLDQQTQSDLAVMMPLMGIVALLASLLALRSWQGALATMLGAGLPVAVWMATLGWVAGSVSALAMAAIPLLVVVGVENTFHLWHRAQSVPPSPTDANAPSESRWHRASRGLAWPLAISNITTAASLLGLATAPLGGVRLLGLTLPLGIAASWWATRWLLPLLLQRVSPQPPGVRASAGDVTSATWPLRWAWPIRLVTLAVVVAGAWALPRLRAEANIAVELSPGTRLARELDAAKRLFGGSLPLSVIVHGSGEPGSALTASVEVARRLRQIPGVASAIGPADSALLAARVALLPEVAAHRWSVGAAPSARLPDYNQDVEAARVFVLLGEVRSVELERQMARMRSALADIPANRIAITGLVPALLELQRDLVVAQLRGLVFSVLIVVAIVAVAFRSLRWGLLAIPSNLLPLGAVAATMAWFDWPVDMGSVQVASLVFGFVVDATVFLLAEARQAEQLGKPPTQPWGHLARPILLTGLLAIAVFACSSWSGLLALQRVGALCAVALAAGLFGDLLFLPTLLKRQAS